MIVFNWLDIKLNYINVGLMWAPFLIQQMWKQIRNWSLFLRSIRLFYWVNSWIEEDILAIEGLQSRDQMKQIMKLFGAKLPVQTAYLHFGILFQLLGTFALWHPLSTALIRFTLRVTLWHTVSTAHNQIINFPKFISFALQLRFKPKVSASILEKIGLCCRIVTWYLLLRKCNRKKRKTNGI